ncbi:MAG: hypothetical protein R3C03_17235 [Pirellulaceae bacterium]
MRCNFTKQTLHPKIDTIAESDYDHDTDYPELNDFLTDELRQGLGLELPQSLNSHYYVDVWAEIDEASPNVVVFNVYEADDPAAAISSILGYLFKQSARNVTLS